MVVDQVLEQETAYTPQVEAEQQQNQQNTVAGSLDPFLSAEKGDIEFWVQILQLLVLYLILREVRR